MRRTLLVCISALVAACTSSDDAPADSAADEATSSSAPAAGEPTEPAVSAVSEAWVALAEEHPQGAIAIDAREALATRLQTRLFETMADEGPAAALEVCAHDAPRIAEAVEEDFEVRIGRTSERLRSPGNQVPEWAQPLAAARVETAGLWQREDGWAVAWSPIVLSAPCTSCHGEADALAPGVSELLAARYPGDRATGYAEGELRGWFWVEVPPLVE